VGKRSGGRMKKGVGVYFLFLGNPSISQPPFPAHQKKMGEKTSDGWIPVKKENKPPFILRGHISHH